MIQTYRRVKTNLIESEKEFQNLEEADRRLGLPDIPMGKNTHTKTKDGYLYNKTKIVVQPSVKTDPIYNILQDSIKSMWNSMSDDHRDNVNKLIIKKSTSRGRGGTRQGGKWKDETKEIIINIHESDIDALGHNFFHEIGHSKWSKMRKDNPEKIKKFREQQEKIGWAPTAYSQSYNLVKEKNETSEENFRRSVSRAGEEVGERNERVLAKNRMIVEDLYHNEIHSELNAYAMGVIKDEYITAPNEYMSKMLKSYKEMWDLE